MLVIKLLVNDVFVRFIIMKLKYIITMFIVEYLPFRIFMMFLYVTMLIVEY